MAKDKIDQFIENIVVEKLEDIIGERFGRYSKYIIQERAIPDVRDGLKPVQRRILYAMHAMKMYSNSGFKKSARVAGEVMGKYHPHGDSSIYEAMVRMSQTWKMGVPLIEMHGNNGSVDGDGPAAMRYTEVRLTKNSEYLLKDIDKKTVNFTPNFDDEELEPTVLPSKFPNILVNGSTGISAGYATNIPPHNLNEVINATIALIDKPNLTIDELLQIMQGPDFPTGGIVQGIGGIRDAFTTGRGRVFVRSKVAIEDFNKDQKRIVVTELPYEVNKATLVKKIEQYRIDKVMEDILEVRDESDRDGLKVVIELKKNANYQAILTYLYKNTDLQKAYNYNMVAIANHRPLTMGVLEILTAYVDHQKEIITNRSNFELEKAQKRIHILEGLIRLVDVLDEVVHIIRHSKNKADSKANIIEKYHFTELQAEAIVTLQLYRLSSTDINALIEENDELVKIVDRLTIVLNSEKELMKVIKNELKEINKNIVVPRQSVIEHEIAKLEINEQELISKEDVMVNVTKDGYIKRSSLRSYNSTPKCGLKENDSTIFQQLVNTTDTMLIFTNLGNYIFVPVYKLEDYKWKDIGVHINSLAILSKNETVISVISVSSFDTMANVLLCTKNGLIKQTVLKDFEVQRASKTIKAMKLSAEDELKSVDITTTPLEIMVVTENADVLRMRASDVSTYGTMASGIKAINLKAKDFVVSAFYTDLKQDIVLLTKRNTIKRMKVSDFLIAKRSRSGSNAIKPVKTNPYYVVYACSLSPNQYKENCLINLIYEKGNAELGAYELKYNVSDSGKALDKNDLGTVLKLTIAKPQVSDEIVNGDYLIEIKPVQQELFTEKTKTNILSDLEAILAKENMTKKSKISDSLEYDEKEKPKFTKISLFNDED